MITPRLTGFLLMALMVSACTSARVVREYYPAQENTPARSTRPAEGSPRDEVVETPAPRPAVQSLPTDRTYIVKTGETLYGISTRFGLKFTDVAAWNHIGEPYAIQSGQRLHLQAPDHDAAPVTATQTASTTTPSVFEPVSSAPPIKKPEPVAAPTTKPAPPSASISPPTTSANAIAKPPIATPPPIIPAPPAVPVAVPTPNVAASNAAETGGATISIPGAPKWRWPTQGQVTGNFVAGDQTQQGINIAGKPGQTILAAADGVVVYSGAGLVGYGELIIIKHSDEWLSAYAHNRRRLVAEGTKVKAGDAIAEMGRTGAIRDMLHFEIRRNGKPVDPLLFLPKQ